MGRDDVSDTAGSLVPNSVPGMGTGLNEREGGKGSYRGERGRREEGREIERGRMILIARQTTDPKNVRT